jgi:hypothetical protein
MTQQEMCFGGRHGNCIGGESGHSMQVVPAVCPQPPLAGTGSGAAVNQFCAAQTLCISRLRTSGQLRRDGELPLSPRAA